MGLFDTITGGLFGGGGDVAGKAVTNEKQRQALIRAGLDQINKVFGGGTTMFYTPLSDTYTRPEWQAAGGSAALGGLYGLGKQGFAPFKPSKGNPTSTAETLIGGGLTVNPTKNLLNPIAGIGGIKKLFGFGDETPSKREALNMAIRKGKVFTGNEQTFEGFQPEFYQQRAQDYYNYALPEYADQYRNARDATFYGLANRGQLGGSVQTKKVSDLERTAGKAKQGIVDTGISQAQDLERQVEAARQDAIQKLYQSVDPSQAVQSAVSTASNLRAPSSFQPLSNLFSNLLDQIYTNQIINSYKGGGGGYDTNDYYSLPSTPITY